VIEELIARMTALRESLETSGDKRRYFHATYLRTTIAVAEEIRLGRFADAEWVERWDVAFAGLYLDALEADMAGGRPSRPWAIAFSAPAGLPPLRHVLLGMNAHINYDLPQALIAVISDEQFGDAALLACREADHRAIDDVLAARVTAEDDELTRLSGPVSRHDQLLRPVSRLATRRFLREAREKVWANATILSQARSQDPVAYPAVLAQLEELATAKVAALQAPGQVLLKLAASGFGVRLPAGALPLPGREDHQRERTRGALLESPPGGVVADCLRPQALAFALACLPRADRDLLRPDLDLGVRVGAQVVDPARAARATAIAADDEEAPVVRHVGQPGDPPLPALRSDMSQQQRRRMAPDMMADPAPGHPVQGRVDPPQEGSHRHRLCPDGRFAEWRGSRRIPVSGEFATTVNAARMAAIAASSYYSFHGGWRRDAG